MNSVDPGSIPLLLPRPADGLLDEGHLGLAGDGLAAGEDHLGHDGGDDRDVEFRIDDVGERIQADQGIFAEVQFFSITGRPSPEKSPCTGRVTAMLSSGRIWSRSRVSMLLPVS